MEILNICSNELASEGQYFESIWTIDGRQITDLKNLEPDTKILLVSDLPMAESNPLITLSKSMRESVSAINKDKDAAPPKNVVGLQGNNFAVDSWKDYYNLSLLRNEEGLNKSKDNWFKSTHRSWATKNQGVLEVAHMSAEPSVDDMFTQEMVALGSSRTDVSTVVSH